MSSPVKVSEAASIALHAMIVMAAAPGETHSTKNIAAKLKVSEAHLSKVLQRLSRAGLAKPVRGPKGGFRLGKPADVMSLLDIYEVIEGPFTGQACLLERPICNGKCCVLGDLLGQVNAMRDHFAATTLEQAVRGLTE